MMRGFCPLFNYGYENWPPTLREECRLKVISSLCHKVDEKGTLLGYYAVISGNFLPMFLDNLLVPSAGFKNIGKKLLLLTL
jgi:hypothetical protein